MSVYTFMGDFGENPDPREERYERLLAERAYWKNKKKGEEVEEEIDPSKLPFTEKRRLGIRPKYEQSEE